MKTTMTTIVKTLANAAVTMLAAEGADAIMSRAHKAAQASHMKRECKDRAYAKLMSAYEVINARYEFVKELSNRSIIDTKITIEAMHKMEDKKDLFDAELHAIQSGILRYADNGKFTGTEVGNLVHLVERLRQFDDAVKTAEELVKADVAKNGFSNSTWANHTIDEVQFALTKNLEDLREDNFLGKC